LPYSAAKRAEVAAKHKALGMKGGDDKKPKMSILEKLKLKRQRAIDSTRMCNVMSRALLYQLRSTE
jgi:hypothetical protein